MEQTIVADRPAERRREPRRLLRWLLVPVLVVPLTLLLGYGFSRDPQALPAALLDKPAPSFDLVGIDGRSVASESLRGRPVVINFWASWCLECTREHPVLMDGHRRYGDEVAFIGVLYQDRVEDARAYLAINGDSGYPNLIDPEGRLALEFGVTGVPETFFLDADGVVRYKQWGRLTRDVLDAQVRALGGTAGARSP
ncbi:MAG: redoxin domain-containing protein [Candidatus Limnocylindria bacterium]